MGQTHDGGGGAGTSGGSGLGGSRPWEDIAQAEIATPPAEGRGGALLGCLHG